MFEGVLKTSEGPQGDLDSGSLFRFCLDAFLLWHCVVSHSGDTSCGDLVFLFLLVLMPEKSVVVCKVFFIAVITSLSY